MAKDSNTLIDALVADLAPVRPLRGWDGALRVALAAALTLAVVLGSFGLAAPVRAGTMSAMFLLANGLLLLLGLAAGASTILQASPRVGNRHDGPRWAMSMAAVFPFATLVLLALHRTEAAHLIAADTAWHCLAVSLVASLLIGGVLLAWLRRGAPVSPAAAGLHLGVAATALGTAIYGLSCPADSLYHLGIWHALPVIAGALAGRCFIPRLLRW
ncbi:MAG: DUF1109 domain-containing protein [Sphingomonadales bacterium]|nr:DUF1109 domain-containing protein [Sphingomonadales bacterium]MBU3991662.1 DUF1109 domain-containing protein [Alphaproteobacteria bacterium]